MAFRRKTEGAVVCASCGKLVGVREEACWNCGRRNPGLWGFGPAIRSLGQDLGFTKVVIGGCILFYLIALALDPGAIRAGGILTMLSPSQGSLYVLGMSGSDPIFHYGRWWTPLSAGWLHGSLLHIGFNLYWFKQLSPAVARLYGPGRSILLFVGSSVTGFAATSLVARYLSLPGPLRGAHITVGASAAVFGWLGALIYYGRRTGSSRMTQQLLSFALPVFVFGLILPMVDNWAHLGGFAGGYFLARFLDPLKPERVDHLLAGLVALALSLLSVAVSVAHAFLPR